MTKTRTSTIDARRFVVGAEGLPDLPGMMLTTIDALKRLGGSGTVQEIVEEVVEIEGISEEEQALLMPNGRDRRVNYDLAWARTFLKRGGALENSARSVWALTEKGETVFSLADTRAIYNQVNEEERERAKAKRLEKKNAPVEGASELEALEQMAEEIADEWQDHLLDTLLGMDPAAFERLSQRLLREAGFVKVEVRGKTGDGGIDGLGVLRVNLVSFQVYFQCKRWSASVGAKEIRDFRGALQGRADKGLFITTSNFTKQASEEATRDGAIAIDLIDGERLCDLLKQYDLGVKAEMVEKITINKEWFSEI